MQFSEFEKYFNDIKLAEFTERNAELRKHLVTVRGEMIRRGLYYSTLTLNKISELLFEEFKLRSQFVSDLILNSLNKIELEKSGQSITEVITLYQNVAFEEKSNIFNFYNEIVKDIEASLQNESSKSIFRDSIGKLIELRILKNNALIELECKAILGVQQDKSKILLLSPNISGIGVDLHLLVQRIFKT
ncbi:MAG: hypothetical protein ACPG52_02290 [Cognaticolwellia sp.]